MILILHDLLFDIGHIKCGHEIHVSRCFLDRSTWKHLLFAREQESEAKGTRRFGTCRRYLREAHMGAQRFVHPQGSKNC